MIIHPPEITRKNGRVGVCAAIELQTQINVPDVMWFEFPENYQDFVTDRADGFAVASLMLAMLLGEHIEVRGVLSPRLAYGMQEQVKVIKCS